MTNNKNYGLATLGVRAGQTPDPATGAQAVPIYQTTSYVFKDSDEAARRFALQEFGQIYSRLTNPTSDVFEARIAAIEGGNSGLSTSSGLAAITYAILNVTEPGDNIVSADNLYGGTYQLFNYTFKDLARDVKFVDSQDLDAFEAAIDEKTKAIYVESVGNPKLDVPDFEKLSEIAHSHDIPLIVENSKDFYYKKSIFDMLDNDYFTSFEVYQLLLILGQKKQLFNVNENFDKIKIYTDKRSNKKYTKKSNF